MSTKVRKSHKKSNSQGADRIKHKLNSHLAVVYGYIQLLQKRVVPGSQEQLWLDKAGQEGLDFQQSIAEIESTAAKP